MPLVTGSSPAKTDRKGLSEDLVDNKEAFVRLFKETLSINTANTLVKTEYKTIKPYLIFVSK